MPNVFFDFETYSALDIKKAGAYKYAEHPSTIPLCLAVHQPGENPGDGRTRVLQFRRGVKLVCPDWLRELLADSAIWWKAQNVQFDYEIWRHCLTARHGWPIMRRDRIGDTAAKAAALGLPRDLERLCAVLKTAPKDAEGHALMKKLCKPAKPTKASQDPFRLHTDANLARLAQYCAQDTVAEAEADDAMGPFAITGGWESVEAMDRRLNARGLLVDVKSARIARDFDIRWGAHLQKKLRALTGGMVNTGKQTKALLAWVHRQGYALPDLKAKTIADALAADGKPGGVSMPTNVREVLNLRQWLARSSTAKLESALACACADGRMRGLFRFHGAGPGRWTGNLFQPQNLPRGVVHLTDGEFELAHRLMRREDLDQVASHMRLLWGCDPSAVCASLIRQYICAAPGKRLLVADFASVEARGVFWLAGCKLGLSQFAQNVDLYRYMGGKIYGISKWEAILKESVERFTGKQATLGCGYGMGAEKFQETCRGYGVELDIELCRKAVQTYRKTYPEVPRLWRDLEAAAIKCVEEGSRRQVGRISFTLWRGRHLRMWLPSGRAITYWGAHVAQVRSRFDPDRMVPQLRYMAVNPVTKQWQRESTYGGKIAENAVQGLCCDLMAEGMGRVEAAGYPPVLTVHDEVGSEVEEGRGNLEEFVALLSQCSAWAKGFPLTAEGFECLRYHK